MLRALGLFNRNVRELHHTSYQFNAPFVVDGAAHRVGASVGTAVRAPGDTPLTVLDRADREMYRAKQGSRAAATAGVAGT